MKIRLPNARVAVIDDADWPRVSQYSWNFFSVEGDNYVYAYDSVNRRRIYLHRLLTTAPDGTEVDHINGDGLDNRRENLRVCTRSQNQANQRRSASNTSGYKGVSWDRSRGKWDSRIRAHGKTHCLGRFDTVEAAAKAYDKKALELFGEYARVNNA